jgi:aspartate kinase
MVNIFKFGGASIKNAKGVKNTARIIKNQINGGLLVVVSAMGKTTDALEKIVALSQSNKDYKKELVQVKNYHTNLARELFGTEELTEIIEKSFDDLDAKTRKNDEADLFYDQIVCYGELISSQIVSRYLQRLNISATWIDARAYIKTDHTFREGKVNWAETEKRINQLAIAPNQVVITQGFIGSTEDDLTITLGREGSDFTAAIFGSCLKAQSVTIWKDVPGVMSADPKRRADAIVFEELPYKEAAEMTYFGASVIHPKTIKPLATRNIPLIVKSFVDPTLEGTKIHDCKVDNIPPLIVFKDNQCLISCKVVDFTFVDETQIGIIFKALKELNIRINLMQNSAISFSFCIDYRESKVLRLIEILSKNFEVYYNANLTLITIKNYDQKTSTEFRNLKGLLLEQSSRSTLQVLLKKVAT